MQADRILVTGGAGFIGSHVVDNLVEKGYEVTVLDNLSTGKVENIRSHINDKTIKFVNGDITDANTVKKASQRCNAVIHLAAVVSVPQSIKEPQLVSKVNVTGTLNVLNSGVRAKINKFVFASSAAVYGDAKPPHHEDLQLRALSPYAATKIAGEYFCKAFKASYDLPIVILRYFNVYGPRMISDTYGSVIMNFMKRVSANKQPVIYGNGKQTRDFIHVEDVAEATVLALENQNVVGIAFNVATGKSTTVTNLYKMFLKVLDRKMKAKYLSTRAGDVKESYADVSLIKKKLHFYPSISLETGLKTIIE